MKHIKTIQKAVAVLLVGSIVLLSGCTSKTKDTVAAGTSSDEVSATQVSYNTKATDVKKNETVYVTLDNYGNVKNTTVTDWLHTDTAETYIEDVSDLTDISNIKSDVDPVTKDGNLIWNMPTTDLYYRGKTDKTLPVSISIQYFI